MKKITKIKILNLKRFRGIKIDFNEKLNLIIGDNEAGKSTILLAIDLVLSGNRRRIEALGLENLFNTSIINEFWKDKSYENLPRLFIEIYLNEQHNFHLFGKINSEEIDADGFRLEICPNDDFSHEISEILEQSGENFPFEYYSIKFKTFSGEAYSGYKKFLNHILIDNTQISNENAMKRYVTDMYQSYVENSEKQKHKYEYRKNKKAFQSNVLADFNERISEDYSFSIKTGPKSNFETDLTISEGDIDIANKGKGRQCFIKTEFALKNGQTNLNIVLIEEPENHLSHINMKKLIKNISNAGEDTQVFIATHNNLISTRLDLRTSILLNNNSTSPLFLNDLTEETAKFFMKAPDNNILEFILSKKVILVEGDAEFILLESFYKKVTGENLEDSDIHVISVGGTSFIRYLEIAKILNIKTCVITDNDGNIQRNCKDKYEEYIVPNIIRIFYDKEECRCTFEVCMYRDNQDICEELFSAGRKTLSVQDYMLKNKANVSFKLLDKKADKLNVPDYIKNAIKWIKE